MSLVHIYIPIFKHVDCVGLIMRCAMVGLVGGGGGGGGGVGIP